MDAVEAVLATLRERGHRITMPRRAVIDALSRAEGHPTVEQITADMTANGVTTPFLLDDGTVSEAYGTLGKGMHAGLPGHSFVLIDRQGRQRWYGEYPSMWLAPQDLLDEIRSNLSA